MIVRFKSSTAQAAEPITGSTACYFFNTIKSHIIIVKLPDLFLTVQCNSFSLILMCQIISHLFHKVRLVLELHQILTILEVHHKLRLKIGYAETSCRQNVPHSERYSAPDVPYGKIEINLTPGKHNR